MTQAEVKDMEKEVRKNVDAEAKRAQDSPVISKDVLLEDVYAKDEEWFIRAPLFEDSRFSQGDWRA